MVARGIRTPTSGVAALAVRGATRYNFRMIRSFRHKGVERFFKSWRLTFAFENGEPVLADYQDDH